MQYNNTNQSCSPSSLPFRPDLQGLRAIAILLVICVHAGVPQLAGGYIGVDVFFVLSGYLITGLLLHELEEKGRISFLRFYTRRLKRLLPALATMLIITHIAALLLLSGTEARGQLATAPFAATWTSNIYYTFASFDYFDELSGRDLFLHTWSLGLEEQFYLVLPLLLVAISGLRSFFPGNRNKPFYIAFTVILIASFATSTYWTFELPHFAFNMMPARMWQFSMGSIVYLVFENNSISAQPANKKTFAFLSRIARITGLLMIFASALLLDKEVYYPGVLALFPSLGAMLIIAAGYGLADDQRSPLAHPLMVWIGDRSYSLYLWHWPVLILGFSLGFQGKPWAIVGLLSLTLLASIFSYRLIELPFWKGRAGQSTPVRILLVSLLIMAILVLVSMQTLRRLPDKTMTSDISIQWRYDFPEIYFMPCDAWYHHARVEPCTPGPQTGDKTVVFLGDSIGAQWYSMLPEIFPVPDWKIIVLTKSSCPIVDEDVFYKRIGRIYDVCTDWRNAVLDKLDILKPDVLVMGSAATYKFSKEQWVEGSSRILERLGKSAATVIVIPGTPQLDFDGPGCVARNLIDNSKFDRRNCVAKDRLQIVKPVTQQLVTAASRFQNVHLLNLNDLVCPEGTCSAVSADGVIVFRDSQHLTDSFVRSRIPHIRKRIDSIMKRHNGSSIK